MGIFGLDAYCREKEVGTLVAFTAKEPRTLVVDLSNVMHTLAKRACSEPCVNVLGGEYASVALEVINFVECLRSAGVTLRCFLDPARGTENDGAKMSTWQQRSESSLRASMAIPAYCDDAIDGSEMPWEMPAFGVEQVIASLRKCGVEVRMTMGEADALLVTECCKEGHYGVVSQDSDFCVIEDSVYLPFDSFEYSQQSVTARVIRNCDVAASLGIDVETLITLAAVCGNDFTSAALDALDAGERLPIKAFRSGNRFLPKDVAAYLRDLEFDILCEGEWFALLEESTELQDAADASHAFYTRDADEEQREGLARLIADETSQLLLPAYSLAVHCHGQYWGDTRTPSTPSVDGAVAALQHAIYVLLEVQGGVVTEYRRCESNPSRLEAVTVDLRGEQPLRFSGLWPLELRGLQDARDPNARDVSGGHATIRCRCLLHLATGSSGIRIESIWSHVCDIECKTPGLALLFLTLTLALTLTLTPTLTLIPQDQMPDQS